jgi:hypothetical protein
MLSRYQVRRVWEFCGGEAPTGTVRPPADLIDDNGHLFDLGVWPQTPLEVMASGESDAVDQAVNRFNQERAMFRNDLLSEERFDELMVTPRVGYPEYTQVIAHWEVRAADPAGAHWHLAGVDNFSPLAVAAAGPATT